MTTSVVQAPRLIFGLASERPDVARKGTLFFATDTGAVSLSKGNSGWAGDLVGGSADLTTITVDTINIGAPVSSTVASGVLTVTGLGSYVDVIGEGATTDTITSIVKTDQVIGDLLLVRSLDADVMTFDNGATMLLSAATHAIAIGGSILFIATTATVWAEIAVTLTTT